MDNLTKFGIFIILSTTIFASQLIDAFEIGTERTYLITNKIQSNDLKTNEAPIGYQLTGKLTVSAVWGTEDDKLLKFKLISPQLHLPSENSINLDKYEQHHSNLDKHSKSSPFYIHWNNGKIKNFFIDITEDTTIRNLKKGLASLFQYQLLDGNYIEEDVSGKCEVSYQSKSSTNYIKTKLNCQTDYDIDFHKRVEKPLGVFVDAQRTINYDVTSEGTIDKVKSKEIFVTYLNANKEVGTKFESILQLEANGAIANIDKLEVKNINDAIKTFKNVKEDNLVSDQNLKKENKTEKNLIKMIRENKKNLLNDKVGTEELALTVIKLLDAASESWTEDFTRILNARTTQDFKGQLLDLFGATQTFEAYEAVKKHLDFTKQKDFEMTERYFQALAVATRPNEKIIEDLLSVTTSEFEEPKGKDTLIQTLGSMAKRFSQLPGHDYESDIVKKVEQHLLTYLTACEESGCKTMYIRGLQNLRSPRTISKLFETILTGDRINSVAAAKALRTFSSEHWTKSHRNIFTKMFYQTTKKFDSTVRTIALDILLTMKPNLEELKVLVEFLKSNEKVFEVKQYLLQRIRMISDECSEFKMKIEKIIRSDSSLNNYNILAQKGISTALARKFTKSPSFNTTLISIQEMSGGVLKSGLVDLTVNSGMEQFTIFSLGMYAGGMSSFVGGDSSENENEDEGEEPNAGMEIIVQGAYMRPLEFFRGQGALMGHVWSGTASESTPAYQGTTTLQDHHEYIRLQNGAIIVVKIAGAVSIDLNGKITISIWNRNAHSVVEKNTAFATEGQINLQTSFVTLRNEFTLVQSPQLELVTDIDVSSNPLLCMQLSQPNTILRHNILKKIEIPNQKHKHGKMIKYKYQLPGHTYALNQKNNEMCNLLINDS